MFVSRSSYLARCGCFARLARLAISSLRVSCLSCSPCSLTSQGVAGLALIPRLLEQIIARFVPQEERYNRQVVLADGRTVSYSVAGNTDGLPVFLFLVRGAN